MVTLYNLPTRQREVLHFIIRNINDKEESPTLQEIADATKMKLSQVQQIIYALEAKKKISTTPHKSRSIVVIT